MLHASDTINDTVRYHYIAVATLSFFLIDITFIRSLVVKRDFIVNIYVFIVIF